MTLGEYVKAYREEHGLSQRGFARLVGLSNTYISYLEKESNYRGLGNNPTADVYRAIAKATPQRMTQTTTGSMSRATRLSI